MDVDNSTSSLSQILEDVSISLASLSVIACIISLVVLIYFKLYRSFIYRLVLYSFISLIIQSSINIVMTNFGSRMTDNDNPQIISQVFLSVSLLFTYVLLLTTIISLCICVLVLCNHQFTYRADIYLLILLIPSFCILCGIYTAMVEFGGIIGYFIFYTLPILVNVFLTVLALVPLCSRACGYNMCVRTIRTKASHRKALKEILPLMILPLPSYVSTLISVLLFLVINIQFKVQIVLSVSRELVTNTLGIFAALSFALHLCFIGKAKLRKQRGRKKTPQVDYGTVNQPHTRHTTVHVEGRGMSETCNTEHQYVNESEEDTRYLLKKNKQIQ